MTSHVSEDIQSVESLLIKEVNPRSTSLTASNELPRRHRKMKSQNMPNMNSIDLEFEFTSEKMLQKPALKQSSVDTTERRAQLTQWDLSMLLFSRIASLGYLFNICVSGE